MTCCAKLCLWETLATTDGAESLWYPLPGTHRKYATDQSSPSHVLAEQLALGSCDRQETQDDFHTSLSQQALASHTISSAS